MEEENLLARAKALAIKLPFDKIDVLVVGEIGKNISGACMDSKVIGRIHILGHTTDFEQEVTSMQAMHQDISEANSGDEVGVRVQFRARTGDRVYKVT